MANLPPPSSNDRNNNFSVAQQLVDDLTNPQLRENALLQLSKHKEVFHDLAPLLWRSPCTIAVLLKEIISVYPYLSPPTLTAAQSNRVCNTLALLQCVAAHPQTRALFLSAQLPLYLYSFLNTTSRSRPFEYLRLTSLGVLGALVKVDDTNVIKFLLSTEIVPLCLRTMEHGNELSRTVATFIVQKVLMDDIGLEYMCATRERFFALALVFENMIASIQASPPENPRLLRHIIRCYLRMSNNPRACDAFGACFPAILKDPNFTSCLNNDPARQWLKQLLHNISFGSRMDTYTRSRSSAVHAHLGEN